MNDIVFRSFTPADQAAVREVILRGLESRFGVLDETANPDVDDIWANYGVRGETFLVAELDGAIIGCGALIHENGSEVTARIVRVSVDAAYQGQGLGRRISTALIEAARERGFAEILVETNEDWESALRLYQGLGFVEYDRAVSTEFGFVEVHMRMRLRGE